MSRLAIWAIAAALVYALVSTTRAGELPRWQVWVSRGDPRETLTACELDAADLLIKSAAGTRAKCERVPR